MIITIFGDVHGNLIALEKLFQLEEQSTDLFVSHGDVVNYGPWSNECVSFLKSKENCITIKGNHEDFYLSGSYSGTNTIARAFFEHCYSEFDPRLLSEIRSYKEFYSINNFCIKHTIADSYIFADTDLTHLQLSQDFVIGHSHQQYFRKLGNFMLYNTGSIGQNRQYLNQSCYIKLDTKTNKVFLKSFIYDLDKLIGEMKIKKYPQNCLDYYLSKEKVII